jgi:phosphate transport system substrate-binding protein
VTITSPKRIGALALIAAFAVGACSGGASSSPSASAAAPQPAMSSEPSSAPGGAVTGSIIVSGSSTVEPISTSVAEYFIEANPGFDAKIEGPGTGDGFKRFCKGETDISDASRKIKQEEADACKAAGIEYVELKIAYDGMTVMTSPANTAITCLSFADLYALTGPESTGFNTWDAAAALAKELGSNTVLPAAPLTINGPGEESGTFDSYVELVITPIATTREKDKTTRPDYSASPNDNTIIEGIAASDTSLGWVGFAFAEENADKVTEIQVSKDPNGTCVAPTAETIADGSYPLSRALYIYVNKAKAAANPAVAAYVDYYLAPDTISNVLKVVPYVNLPASELDATRATWEAAK